MPANAGNTYRAVATLTDVRYIDNGIYYVGDLKEVEYADGFRVEKEAYSATAVDEIVFGVAKSKFTESFTATSAQYDEVWALFKSQKWDDLQNYFKNGPTPLNTFNGITWPPNFGFSKILPAKKSTEVKGLATFDRFQGPGQNSLGGGFASPVKNGEKIGDLSYTYDSRMLSDQIQEGTIYFQFQFSNEVRQFDITYGDVMPWFNKSNTTDLAGQQVMFGTKLHDLPASNFTNVKAQEIH